MSEKKSNRYTGQNLHNSSRKESKYNKIFRIFYLVCSYPFSSNDAYIVTLFSLASVLIVFGPVNDIRTISLLFTGIIFLIWWNTKNIVFSSFLVCLFCLQFFQPNKYYMVEVIKGIAFDSTDFLQGHQIGFGLNIPNVFLILTVFLWIREMIRKKSFIKLFRYKIFFPIVVSALGFFAVSQYAIVKYSAFKELSQVWLLQYMQLFAVAFLMLYFFITQKKYFSLIYPVFYVSLVLQFYISIRQFINQSFGGLPIESGSGSFFQAGLDENNAVFRVAGTFMFHNQLALIMLVLTVIILPIVIAKYSLPKTFIVLMSLITIALTQSRSIWLALIPICIMAFLYFKNEISRIISLFSKRRIVIYSLLLLLSLSYVIFPRIILSLNALYQGAGIPLRVQLITEGIEAFMENPFVGYGAGTNEYVLYTLSPKGVMTEFPAPVHLAFLQLALETGLLGVSFFVFPFLFLSRIIINLFMQKSAKVKQLNAYIFPFISGMIAFLIYYLFLAHVGIIEFAYLGIILGFGMISVISIRYAK